jgi:Lysyl oxidase
VDSARVSKESRACVVAACAKASRKECSAIRRTLVCAAGDSRGLHLQNSPQAERDCLAARLQHERGAWGTVRPSFLWILFSDCRKTIMIDRAHRFLLVLGGLIVAVIVATPVGSAEQATDLTPNIVALAASELSVVTDTVTGSPTLRFGTTSWNNGSGPLELRAGAVGQAGQDVYQRIYRSDSSYYDRLAGTYVYHPLHQHFHFEGYALYTLRPLNAPGASDRQSSKTTFCVMDTTSVNTSLPGAPTVAFYTTCGSGVQGMSVGWGDRYGPSLPGQSFDLTGSPDGDYQLIIQIDPQQRLLESNESDNMSCVKIRIGVASRSVQNLGTCTSQGAVTIASVTPNTGFQGSTLNNVTISGSGFASGMAVGFENGSGPAPIPTGVQVLDGNTIRLTVTIKTGGPRKERLWDVRVGSGVLQRGFKVLP